MATQQQNEHGQKREVLVIGIGLPIDPEDEPELHSEEVRAASAVLKEGMKPVIEELAQANLTASIYLCKKEKPAETIAGVRKICKEHDFYAVGIGYGIRGERKDTALFEELVNVCIRESPSPPIMAFPVLPTKVVEAFKRVLPEGTFAKA